MISLLLYFDHQAHAWKYLYSLAVPRYAYYVSRLIQIFIFMLVTFLLFHIFILAGIQLYKWIKPDCEIESWREIMKMSTVFLSAVFISAFPLIIIQYWISLISKNIIVPFIVGILAITLPVAVIIILGIAGLITNADMLH